MIKLLSIFVLSMIYVTQGLFLNSNELQPRIINGKGAKTGDFPFMVMLLDVEYFATGVILNKDWVLTAASGLGGRVESQIEIVAGCTNLSKLNKAHRVEKIIVHEKFVGYLKTNDDIALLKVTTPFEFSDTVQPINLPKPHLKVETNTSALVSGWGAQNANEPVASNELQVATVYIVDQEYCKNLLKERHMIIYDSNICANDPTVETGPCFGDSGAPLTVESEIIGIASWSLKDPSCGSTKYPAIYTRVSEYIHWILDNSKNK